MVLLEVWGRFRAFILGIPTCSHKLESGLPEKAACSPVTWVGLGETRAVRDGFPRMLCSSAEAVPESGTQAAPVIVVGGHERADPLERRAANLLLAGWWKPERRPLAGLGT